MYQCSCVCVETFNLNTHPFILFHLVLVVLVVFLSKRQISDISETHIHIHTLRGGLILAVSLPFYSSNKCWHTTLCGTLGQLEDTQRFCSSVILTTPLSTHLMSLSCSAFQSYYVYCVSVRSALINSITFLMHLLYLAL